MNPSINSLRTRVYAKVNLALAVGKMIPSIGGQGGELHPICSWMYSINLADEVEIRRLGGGQSSSYAIGWASGHSFNEPDKPVEWSLDQDLAVRMHRSVEEHIGKRLPVKIRVSKSIPAGGGLGGGSADAAGVLMGLNDLFNLEMGLKELVTVAMKLGSDIPFFIDPGHPIPRPAIVEGVGDQITRLGRVHEGTPIMLFFPNFGCNTGEVYRAFDAIVGCENTDVFDSALVHELASHTLHYESRLFNDLAPPAIKVQPMLGEIREALQDRFGGVVHISGSGSTLFAFGEPIGDENTGFLADQQLSVAYTQLR